MVRVLKFWLTRQSRTQHGWRSVNDEKKSVRDLVKQEYMAYLFINNRNQKLHSQLKKDVANDYSKGNIEAYPSDIHKALTL